MNQFFCNPDGIYDLICRSNDKRIFFLHHYDRLGYLPNSWRSLLLDLQSSSCQAILSTSRLDDESVTALERGGVYIAKRKNSGRCIGSYCDFARLADIALEKRHIRFTSIILANDSVLPIVSSEVLTRFVKDFYLRVERDKWVRLHGLTDCYMCDSRHLQSYFIGAGRNLLIHPAWKDFWRKYQHTDRKRDLIRSGEVGLSRSMSLAGIRLNAEFSIVMLARQMPDYLSKEISALRIRKYKSLNPSISAWRTLIRIGFPFIKKSVLLDECRYSSNTLKRPCILLLSELVEGGDRPDYLYRDIEMILGTCLADRKRFLTRRFNDIAKTLSFMRRLVGSLIWKVDQWTC